uniref:I/LWEQ domain-containing protein n=1 Tax=Anabas testudineus TaxID=64144 RepID=A0A7N6A5Z0_ANATE
SSISKAITSTETPVKEKHARRIILGTHREKGAFTFWSYALGFPLASSSILSWKFCHVLHKVLRDGHKNVSPLHSESNLHDRYGQLVALYTKLLCTKMEFHVKVRACVTFHTYDTKIHVTLPSLVSILVIRQLNTSIAVSSLTSGQCRLAPLIQVIQDCSPLYHFTVKLLFKLHACLPADTLQGHRERFHDQFHSDTSASNFSFLLLKAQRYITQLKSQINSLEAELEEQRAQKQRALVENEQLRMELEATRRRNAEHEGLQTTFFEAEKKAQATEQRYNKLKEKHTELVASHAELLRKVQTYSRSLLRCLPSHISGWAFLLTLAAICLLWLLLSLSFCQTSEQMKSSMTALQAEKERVMRSVSEKEAELSSLRQAAQVQQSSLQQERDRNSRELGELQGKLREKVSQREQLKQKLLEEQFVLLQGTVAEAEKIIQDAVAKLDDPLHIRCTSSPDYLVSRAEAALSSIENVKKGHADYLSNMGDAGALLRALTQFSHLAADTIINGSATAHMAPTDHADRLTDNCRSCATQSIKYLSDLKSKITLQRADPASIRIIIQKILNLGQELRPKGMDVRQEELGDLVDREMAATSAAIEEAVRRIDEMMNQTRKDTTGVKLEVNERILFSCTDLMKAIRMLVVASTDLQKEIVEGGRGAATIKEFYARNSRWTEGLISAAKAVGWGATEMVESADKVVLHTGKYEELIVCSHEIAASTAQLVAASKVKADRNSKKLSALQQASRHVNEMAANVVASTKTGQEHLEEKDTMDFSGMSLIKLRKEEMESQVKVLELESQLENERLRLGELRKKHYDLAGVPLNEVSEGNGETSLQANPFSLSPKPTKPALMKKPALAQKPNIPPKTTARRL